MTRLAWALLAGLLIGMPLRAMDADSAKQGFPAFSALKPGQALPPGLRFIAIPKVKHNQVSLVADEGVTVLKVDSGNSAGSIGLPFNLDPLKTPLLSWRWKVNRVIDKADMEEKSGDDFAARVYVFFDVPLASLSFTERSKIRIARLIAGPDVPTAALVYVWDNKHRIGFAHASPFTRSVQKFVLQSGPENVGKWKSETRDVAADFRTAFGREPPRVTGVAVGNDTDQTDEQVTSWFGDFHFSAKAAGP
jgi:Protein of unknown function (DUF3047)